MLLLALLHVFVCALKIIMIIIHAMRPPTTIPMWQKVATHFAGECWTGNVVKAMAKPGMNRLAQQGRQTLPIFICPPLFARHFRTIFPFVWRFFFARSFPLSHPRFALSFVCVDMFFLLPCRVVTQAVTLSGKLTQWFDCNLQNICRPSHTYYCHRLDVIYADFFFFSFFAARLHLSREVEMVLNFVCIVFKCVHATVCAPSFD